MKLAGLLAALLLLVPISLTAATPWEAAVLFLGAQESPDYQADIDKNILELARVKPDQWLRLSIYREFKDRSVSFHPDPTQPISGVWDGLFFKVPQKGIPISGQYLDVPRVGQQTLLQEDAQLSAFFQRAYPGAAARRLLIVYGHGEGFEGLRGMGLKSLRRQLESHLPQRGGPLLDIFWLNSCFMGTAEVAYELRGLSKRLMASEDAEFSAGAPFNTLQDELEGGPDDIDPVAAGLAEQYLTSYSFTEGGSHTPAVYKSSATISVIHLARMENLVASMAAVASGFKSAVPDWKRRLQRRVPGLRMERADLVDTGALLLAVKDLSLLPVSAQPGLKAALRTIEVGRRGKVKTNLRLLVKAPVEDSHLVYGYENWVRGHEGDADILGKLPANLTPQGFVSGPKGRRWPERTVHKQLYLTPFTVGLNRFDFFFADSLSGRPLTPIQSRKRESDLLTFEATTTGNPVLFSGYTQGIGKNAERYTGLAILNPLNGVPSLDYVDTDFYQKTHWGDF